MNIDPKEPFQIFSRIICTNIWLWFSVYSCFLKVSFFLSNLNLISLTFLRLDLCSNVFGLALLYSPKMIPYLDLIEQHPSMHNGAWLSYAELAESVRKYKKSTTSFWFALFSTFFGLVEWPSLSSPHWQFLKLCFLANISSVTHWGKNQYHAYKIQYSEFPLKSRFWFIVYLPHCLKITQNAAVEFLNFGIFHQFLSY